MIEHTPATFEQVYSDYYQRIYQHLSRLLHNAQDAEDLTQETFLKAYKVFATLEVRNVSAWLYRVATNTAYDVLRRRRVITFSSLDTDNGEYLHPISGDEVQEDSAEREAINAALAQMRPSYRKALVLQHVEGYSLEDIACIYGRGYDATKTLTYHARRDFKRHYQREVQACP